MLRQRVMNLYEVKYNGFFINDGYEIVSHTYKLNFCCPHDFAGVSTHSSFIFSEFRVL